MANTYVDYTATAAQTDFAFSFPYLEDSHVTVEIDGVATTDFTIVTTPSTKIVLDSGATAGQLVRVIRKSQPDTNLVDFVNGSVLTESELDRAYLHNRYLAEESAEQNDVSMRLTAGATGFDALNKKIFNVVDPTSDQDAATKNYVDETVAGVALGTVPDGSITDAKLDTDAVTTVKIENGAVTSAKIEDGAVTTAKIEDNAVTSAKTSLTNLVINETASVISASAFGVVEVGGPSGGYIDLKSPSSDDYDARFFSGSTTLDIHGKYGIVINTGDPAAYRAITILDDGKVRIGSADDPTHALDVSGDVNVSLGNTFKINGANFLLDEDAMTSNSDTQGATQQSIKAYVDSQVSSVTAKYTADWDTSHGGTTVANGATLTITHNLGTTDVLVSAYVNSSASDSGATIITQQESNNGAFVTNLTTNTITLQLGSAGYVSIASSGVGTAGNSYASQYIKVVVIG